MLVALVRRPRESLHQLLDRLEQALGPAVDDQIFVDEINGSNRLPRGGLCASVAIRIGLRAKSRLHAVRADRFSGAGRICLSFLFLTSNLGHSRLGDAAFQPQARAE